jgi:hypothetical protein
MDNGDALLLIVRYEPGDDFHRIVCGIVKELDLQSVSRVIEGSDGFYEPADNVALVVDRELNGDARKVGFPRGHLEVLENILILLLAFAAVPEKEQQQHIAVGSVEKEPAEAQDVECA